MRRRGHRRTRGLRGAWIAACMLLLGCGGPDPLEVMAPLLADDDPVLRADAAWLLGQSGHEDAADALLPLWQDQDERVRAVALASSSLLGVRGAGEALAKGLEGWGPGAQAAAIRALGLPGVEVGLPVLMEAARGGREELVQEARDSLLRIGTAAALDARGVPAPKREALDIPDPRALLNDPEPAMRARALEGAPTDPSWLDSAHPDVRFFVLLRAKGLTKERVAPLVEDPFVYVRMAACVALLRLSR